MSLAGNIKNGDWESVRKAIAQLSSIKLGPTSTPVFSGITVDTITATGLIISGLTASRLIASDASKNIVSVDLSSWITGTSNRLTVTDDGDGTVTLNTKNIIPVFNITDYGAIGDDSTECATAIQAAIDAAEAVGGMVYIPEGTYKFSTGLTITATVTVKGATKSSSILKKYGNVVGININAAYIVLDNFQLTAGTNTLNGFTLTEFSRGSINNVIVTNQGSHGIEFLSGNLASFSNIICLSNGGDGFKLNGTHDNPDTNACYFSNLDCRGNGGVGFNIENGRSNVCNNIVCQINGTYGIRINDRSNLIYAYCESNTTKDYFITNEANAARNTLYIMQGGDSLLTDSSTGTNTIYAENIGDGSSGFGQTLRATSFKLPNSDYVGTLDLTHNGADREFAFIAGGTSADETLFFKNANATYKLHLNIDGSVSLKEKTSANSDIAGYGQIWVKNDTPNTLWFTDDAGTDVQIGTVGASGSFTTVDSKTITVVNGLVTSISKIIETGNPIGLLLALTYTL